MSGSGVIIAVILLTAIIIGVIGAAVFVLGLNLGGTSNQPEMYLGLGIIFIDVVVAGLCLRFAGDSEES